MVGNSGARSQEQAQPSPLAREFASSLSSITSLWLKPAISFWHASCSRRHRHAWKTQSKGWKCPRRRLFSERRLPLRQPPAEQPFSASPRNWNPASNGWVLLRLAPIICHCGHAHIFPLFLSLKHFPGSSQPATDFVTLTVTFSVFLTPFLTDLRNSASLLQGH